MAQLVLNISDEAYAILAKASFIQEEGQNRTVESVLEEELSKPDVFIEMMGWEDW